MAIKPDAWPLLATVAVLVCLPAPARGQQRSDENAVTQAEDGFGFSIGRETLGIYSADDARGFSPTEAGNVRIDGLYFDPATSLSSGLVGSTTVRVGLSAQGYPFAAPSGIVDQKLRTPAAGAGASLIANFDQYGTAGLELNGSLLLSNRLGIGYGLSGSRVHFTDGTRAWQHSETLLAQWRAGLVQLMPFWSLYDDVDDTSNIFFVPAKLPPAHHSQGPIWGAGRYTGTNLGLISSVDLGRNWLLRSDLVRSVGNQRHGFSNFLVDELPDGTGELITVADPPAINRAISGEVRLTHSIADGPRLHVIHVSIRGRDHRRQFGGSDVIDNGPATAGQMPNPPEPLFNFGELSRDWVRQLTFGVAYSGQWKNRGGLAFGLSRTNFSDATSIPGSATAKQTSREWLYNIDGAVNLTRSIILYAGQARGLEESGVAPANAANRHQPLPVVLTEQTDAGVRFNLGPGVHAVVGVFDLSRPYFGYSTPS